MVVGGISALGALEISACGSGSKGGSAATFASAQASASPTSTPAAGKPPAALATNADQALQLLKEGNQRFVENRAEHVDDDLNRRIAVRSAQRPFATILSCVDSRVPVEIIFDRGFGDLVVIRSAGEVLDHAVTGSLEFGVAELNTPLLMVLGHQRCGALTAAVNAYDKKSTDQDDLGYLVTALAPAVRQASGRPGDRVTNAVRANVALTLNQLRQSPILGPSEAQGKFTMVGAYYDLDTGQVEII
jgi:carbonic anhydrase